MRDAVCAVVFDHPQQPPELLSRVRAQAVEVVVPVVRQIQHRTDAIVDVVGAVDPFGLFNIERPWGEVGEYQAEPLVRYANVLETDASPVQPLEEFGESRDGAELRVR